MIAADKVRRCEVRQADGAWVVASSAQLEPGDVFRLFEPSGAPVVDPKGVTAWEVTEHTRTYCKPAAL